MYPSYSSLYSRVCSTATNHTLHSCKPTCAQLTTISKRFIFDSRFQPSSAGPCNSSRWTARPTPTCYSSRSDTGSTNRSSLSRGRGRSNTSTRDDSSRSSSSTDRSSSSRGRGSSRGRDGSTNTAKPGAVESDDFVVIGKADSGSYIQSAADLEDKEGGTFWASAIDEEDQEEDDDAGMNSS